MSQQEYLFGWRAHEYSDVFNVQFSSDETSVYSMGCDQHFSQWSINKTGDKLVDYNIHEHACSPTEGRLKGEYFPSTPQGNLFAFEDEDKFVLTCAPDQAIVYQVRGRDALGVGTCSSWFQVCDNSCPKQDFRGGGVPWNHPPPPHEVPSCAQGRWGHPGIPPPPPPMKCMLCVGSQSIASNCSLGMGFGMTVDFPSTK